MTVVNVKSPDIVLTCLPILCTGKTPPLFMYLLLQLLKSATTVKNYIEHDTRYFV